MSKKNVSRLVWAKYHGGASRKLVLLLVAELSASRTANPSIKFIAQRCAISERQAQYIVNEMLESGLLLCVSNKNGGKPGATRHVVINEQVLTGATNCTPTGEVFSTPLTTDTGAAHCTQVVSKHRQKKPLARKAKIVPSLRLVVGGE